MSAQPPPPKRIRWGAFGRGEESTAPPHLVEREEDAGEGSVSKPPRPPTALRIQLLPTPLVSRPSKLTRYGLPLKSTGKEDVVSTYVFKYGSSEWNNEARVCFARTTEADGSLSETVAFLGFVNYTSLTTTSRNVELAGSIVKIANPVYEVNEHGALPFPTLNAAPSDKKTNAAILASPTIDASSTRTDVDTIDICKPALRGNYDAFFSALGFEQAKFKKGLVHNGATDRYVLLADTRDVDIGVEVVSVVAPQPDKLNLTLRGMSDRAKSVTVILWKSDAVRFFGTSSPSVDALRMHRRLLFVQAKLFRNVKQLALVAVSTLTHTPLYTSAIMQSAFVHGFTKSLLDEETREAAKQQESKVLSEGWPIPLYRCSRPSEELIVPASALVSLMRDAAGRNGEEYLQELDRVLDEASIVAALEHIDQNVEAGGLVEYSDELMRGWDALGYVGQQLKLPVVVLLEVLRSMGPEDLATLGVYVRTTTAHLDYEIDNCESDDSCD